MKIVAHRGAGADAIEFDVQATADGRLVVLHDAPDSVFEHHVVGTASTSGAAVAHVHAGDLTPSISERLHRLGLDVHANDAATAEDVRRAVRADADRVSANDVDLALDVVRQPL